MPGLFDTVAAQNGLDPALLDRIARIESGGNPGARTGSYHGLFQLSNGEFNKYGGGNIYSAADNASAAARKIAAEAGSFRQQYNREPTPIDIYMLHQQGPAGYAAHIANPDAPAWKNMLSTGEGRQKGAGWARQAIWGNVPDQFKGQFGNVDNLTSQQFVDLWRHKVEGAPGAPLPIGASVAANVPQSAGLLSNNMPSAPQGLLDTNSGQTPDPLAGISAFLAQQQQQQQATPQLPPMMPMQPMQIPEPPMRAALRQRLIASAMGLSPQGT